MTFATSLPQVDGQGETETSLCSDPNPRKSKRQKTRGFSGEKQRNQASNTTPMHPALESKVTEQSATEMNTEDGADDSGQQTRRSKLVSNQDASSEAQRSNKLLRLNSQGTLGSPNKSTKTMKEEDVSPPKSRSRRKRATKMNWLVVISYGVNNSVKREQTGRKINHILNTVLEGSENTPNPSEVASANLRKPTHPFFTTKILANKSELHDKDQKPLETELTNSNQAVLRKSFTTPVKPRSMLLENQETHKCLRSSEESPPEFCEIRRDPRGPPGAPWPWKGFGSFKEPNIIHSSSACPHGPHRLSIRQRKKAKQTETLSDGGSTFLEPYTQHREHKSNVSARRTIDTEESLKEKLAGSFPPTSTVSDHPACTRMFERVGDRLSTFDRGVCESRPWTQIYAPDRAESVLQPTSETNVLRNWLSGLSTDAVERPIQQKPDSTSATPQVIGDTDRVRQTKRKRRQKRREQELDDFIISDEEEDDEMQALDDDEVGSSLRQRLANRSESVIRSGDVNLDGSDPRRVMNAVLLSGPHGCGKTAAAYAIAKDLGFSVFEISPSMRRSGKDVLDKVGDMSLNHQVRKADLLSDEPSFELPQEPEAGQNTLNAFFQGKQKKKKPGKNTQITPKESPNPSKKSAKPQKQSLILLEEVDVLFEDDKQFWETVSQLAKQSRRPIIMTCNDESTLPHETLFLHAVLRFKPPPIDLATRYLCFVAACEGHLIDPDHVTDLYCLTGKDLRASLTELSFWCQMTVGSTKGGLDWHLKRWPIGSDLDSLGRQLHVVSNGTYNKSLRSIANDTGDRRPEHTTLDAWSESGIEPGLLAAATLRQTLQFHSTIPSRMDQVAYEQLKAYSNDFDSLSAADTLRMVDYPNKGIHTIYNALDPSAPLSSHNTATDYVQCCQYLAAEPLHDYSGLAAEMYTSICLGVYETNREQSTHSAKSGISLLDDLHTQHMNAEASSYDDVLDRADLMSLNPLSELLLDTVEPSPSIAVDIAPYVRSIIAYDLALEQQRSTLAEVHSEGRAAKRVRTTRASRSALEGGMRASTRRERWFGRDVDYACLMRTGGYEWPRIETELVRNRQRPADEGWEVHDAEHSDASERSI